MSRLSTVLLLTSKFYTQRLIEMSVQKSPGTAVIYVEHPNELIQFGEDFLKTSRLISFGSRFYVKPELLSLIGYGSYNFHPGPPHFPGWAPFNFALYEDAPTYGVTVHEMTSDIDAGVIVGTKSFQIPPACDVQLLMDLTTEAMYQLYDEMVTDFAEREPPLNAIDENWSGHIWTKKDFENMCQIPLDVSEHELNRRIHAFGSSDGINLPYIILGNHKFMIAEPEDNFERKSHYLFGHRFIKMGMKIK